MSGWAVEASRILRAERVRAGLTYRALRMRLAAMGVQETDPSLRNKFSRGTFTFVFFLQCMHVFGRRSVDVGIDRVPEPERREEETKGEEKPSS